MSERYDSKIKKFSGSELGVILPEEVLKELKLSKNDNVKLELKGNRVVVEKRGFF